MADTPVNGVGWYLDSKGTLISPWQPGTGGENANNPYSNVSGFWGTSNVHGPEGAYDHYINSITQMPYGTVGRFALGQRPDAYMGLATSPIIQQQLANIDTQSKVGYGGGLGRWQFGSTGNAPATAPLGWGRNPGSGAAAAAWQPTQYKSNWYEPGSGNGQNMGGGNGNAGGGGGNNGGGGGGGTDWSQTNPQNTAGPAPTPTGGLLSKATALQTNRIPRDNTQAAIDYTNQIMSAGTSQNRPASGTLNMGQILWAVNQAKKAGNYDGNWYNAWNTYKDGYREKPLSDGNNWLNGVHR